MTAPTPEETARRRTAFRAWAAAHDLVADETVGLIQGVLYGARIRLATGISEKGHWPIIVDVAAPLDRKERLRELVGAAGIPRSLTSIVGSRAGARLRFWPIARLEDIEVVIAALPRKDTGAQPYR